MKKDEIKKNVLGLTEKVIREKINKKDIWPPYCNGIFHQPRRPKNNREN